MGKIDIEFRSKRRQCTVGSIQQGISGAIIHRSEPFALEYSPERLGDVQMRTVWREEKEEQSSFLPNRTKFSHEATSVDARIVKDNKRVLADPKRKSVKEVCDFVGGHILGGGESFISVVTVYHTENIESQSSFGRNIDILTAELPSVWHISSGADVAFISIIKVDETVLSLLYEFLQLLGLIRIELRRGCDPWAFPYTLISCAKTSKKRLKVESLTCLPEEDSHSSFAVLMLCRCFCTASFTAGVSALLISGFCPRPPFSRSPSRPSFSYRLNQSYTASLPYPTTLHISDILAFSAFIMTALHRIRKRWQDPKRYALSSSARASWLNIIVFVFPIVFAFLSIQWRM